jgi:hypothetical protein
VSGANNVTAFANAEYGSSAYSTASQNHGRGARGGQLGKVSRAGHECEIAGTGLVHRRDADDVHVAVAVERALQSIRDVL